MNLRRTRAALAIVIASLPLGFAVVDAQAHRGGSSGGGGNGQSQVVVAGTVVSVNATANSFVADAYIVSQQRGGPPPRPYSFPYPQGGQGGRGSGDGRASHGVHMDSGGGGAGSDSQPTTTQVTILTNSSTRFRVNRAGGTISDLAAGDKFIALFNGSSSEDITTLVNGNPAIAVEANSPPKPKQLYAFVGTVTAVDTTNDTITVNVSSSLPAGLVPSSSNPATFTIGANTLVLGGTSGNGASWGSLSNVGVGDVVAGGLIAPSGETLSQVEATPLRLLLDIPASTAGSHATKARTKSKALAKAKALLGYKAPAKHSKKHKKH